MLLNLAEDLKEHAKMKVSPNGKKLDAEEASKKKGNPSLDDVKEAADAAAFVKLDKSASGNIDAEDLEDDSFDDNNRQSFLYMEL
jgi:ribosomal protein S1